MRRTRFVVAAALGLAASPAHAIVTSHVPTDAQLNALLPVKSFVPEGRIGDLGGAATFELDIGNDTGAPAQTAQYAWPNGSDVPFTISYDGTTARLIVGSKTVAYSPAQIPGGDFFVRTRSNKAGASIRVNSLVLDGLPIADQSYAVFGTNGGLDILRVQGGDLAAPFALTGVVRMTWNPSARPTNSNLAFQVKVGVVTVATPPTVNITSPAPGTLFGASPIAVSGTVSGTAPVSVSVNGVAATVTGGTWTASVPLVEGANTLTATATNSAGSATDTAAVTLDTTPPVVTITSPPDGLATAAGSVTVTGTVVDASPIASFTVNGVAVPLVAGAFTTTVPLASGANPITAVATDAAGNTGQDAITVTRGAAPAITITSPTSGLLTNETPIPVTGTVTGVPDPTVTVNGVTATVTGGTWTASVPVVEGANLLTASATNAFGSASAKVSVTLDTIPPLVVISLPADGFTTVDAAALVQGFVVDASPIASFTLNAVPHVLNGIAFAGVLPLAADGDVLSETPLFVANGLNPIEGVATDAAGNVGSAEIVVIRGRLPILTLDAPADGLLTAATRVDTTGTAAWTGGVTLNGLATPVVSLPDRPVPWSISAVPLVEGRNVLQASASNEFGTATAEVVVTLDTTPPVVTIVTPADGSTTGAAESFVTGTVEDASPIASFTLNGLPVALDPTGAFEATLPLAPGANAITAVAIDAVGNTGSDAVSVTRGGAPTVTITAPADGALLGATPVTVTGSESDADQVTVSGVAATVAAGAWTASVALVEGPNTLTATATNPYGSAEASVTVTLDTTPPVVTIVSPGDGARTSGGTIWVAGTVEDASPIASFTLNGVATALDPSGVFVAEVPLPALGSNAISAVAVDAVGLSGSDAVSVLRGAPPTIAIHRPAPGTDLFDVQVDVDGPVSDADTVVVNGSAGTVAGGFYQATIALPGDGTHTVSAVATNEFGVAIAETTVDVLFSGGPLTVTITQPPDGSKTAVATVEVLGTTNYADATVTVNDIPAASHDGSFSATVPVAPGPNPIVAVATRGPQTASDAISVTRVAAVTGQVRVVLADDEALQQSLVGGFGTTLVADDATDFAPFLVSLGLAPTRFAPVPATLDIASSPANGQLFFFVFSDGAGDAGIFASGPEMPPAGRGTSGTLLPIADLATELSNLGLDPLLVATLPPSDFTSTHFGVLPFYPCFDQPEFAAFAGPPAASAGGFYGGGFGGGSFGFECPAGATRITAQVATAAGDLVLDDLDFVFDASPPRFGFTFPPNGATVGGTVVTVEGEVADALAGEPRLPGSIGSVFDEVSWVLNGFDAGGAYTTLASGTAPVVNGAFQLVDLPVGAGGNQLFVTAFDAAGNQSVEGELAFNSDPAGTPGAIAPTIDSTPPTAATEDVQLDYAISATDPDPGDVLSYFLVSGPPSAAVDAQTGLLTWFPTNADVGPQPFTVRVLDLAGLSATQTFTVTVANVNDPPFGSDGTSFTLNEDVPFRQPLVYFDEDAENPAIGEVLSFARVSGPAGLVFDAGLREIRWTPTQANVGPATLVWTVRDLAGLVFTSTWYLDVLQTNDTPRISSVPPTYASEDTPYSYAIVATDEEDGSLAPALVTGPSGMTIDAGGVVRFTPTDADVGPHVVELRVTDSGGASLVQRYTLLVTGVPDAPFISSVPVTTAAEDAAYDYDVDVVDPDVGDSALFSLVRAPAGMTIDAGTGVVFWVPTQAQVGSHAVEIRVRDGAGLRATQAYTVTVAPSNDAPVITSAPPTQAGDNEPYVYAISVSDPDPAEAFTYQVAGPAGMAVDAAGVVTWTPGDAEIGGSFPVTVTVRDAAGAPASQAFSVAVVSVNNAPSFSSSPPTVVAPGASYAYDADATDPDAGDVLTFALESGPAGMTVHPSTGVVAWTPVLPDEAGENAVTLRVTDAAGRSGTQSFSIYAKARPVAAFAAAKRMRVSATADGARVVATENAGSSTRRDDLLDGLNAQRVTSLPGSFTVDLAGDRAHALRRLTLRAPTSPAGYGVRDFELRVSETGTAPADFTLAFAGTLPNDAALHVFDLAPRVSARFAKLVVLSGWGPANDVRIAELRLETDEHDGGVVTFAGGGASIVASSPSATSLGPDRLLDRDVFTIWRTPPGTAAGAFVTVELGGGAPTVIDRVRTASGGGGNSAVRDVEIWTSSTGTAPADFTRRAQATLPRGNEAHWITFPPVDARYLKLVVVSNHGEDYVTLGELHAFGLVGAETVAFEDVSVDPGGRVVAWQWAFGDGGTSAERHPTHVYAGPGVYDVTLTITDVDGFTGTVTRPYRVFARATADFTVTPAAPGEGVNVTFTDASSDPDGTIVSRLWTVPDAPPLAKTLSAATTRFDDDGSYDVTLEIEDSQWIPVRLTRQVVIGNGQPTADAGAARTVAWGEPVVPKATISDSLGDRNGLSCSWDWGDGQSTSVPSCKTGQLDGPFGMFGYLPGSVDATHAYASPGSYTATLSVTDGEGGSAQDTVAVTVTRRPASLVIRGAGPADAAGDAPVTVRLVDVFDAGNVLSGAPITFTLGAQTAVATTNAAGEATATLRFAVGTQRVGVAFAGDALYDAVAESADFTSAALPGTPVAGAPPAPDHRGTEFFLAFPPNYDNDGGWVDLFVASAVPNVVTIEIPGLGYGPVSYALAPNETRHLSLPVEVRLAASAGRIEAKGVRVYALHEISVQALDNIHYTTDGYLALPAGELGTEYLAASFQGLGYPGYFVDGQVTIAAVQDGTQVTITPSAPVVPGPDTPPSVPAGVPFTVSLDRFEALTLHAQALSSDLSGTEISATAPVAVYGGHQCAYVPTEEPYCDHLVEMLPPTSTWGTEFVKAAYHRRTNGDFVRVLASQDGTVVRVNGVAVATLDRGETFERANDVEIFEVIETSAPALAWQFEKGVQPYRAGDPSVALLTPVSQWPTGVWGYALPLRYRGGIGAFGSGYSAKTGLSTSLNVVARSQDLNGFVLGGAPLLATWTPIADGTYAQTRIAIQPDRPIHLRHRSPAVTFGAWLTGLFQYDSYGYPLGTRLAPLGATCTPAPSVAGNGLDDDCDGRIDEETGDGLDQDLDGLFDEDLAAGEVAVNAPPTAVTATYTTDEDSAVGIVLQGADPNGQALTFTIVDPPRNGTLTGTPPVLTYTPNPDYPGDARGVETIRYVASDGLQSSAPASIFVVVRGVNDPPVITSTAPPSAIEDALYAYALTWTDADPYDQATVTVVSGPAGLAWNATTARLEWTPTNAQVGAQSATVRVADLRGAEATQTFAVTVANTNDAPVITSTAGKTAVAGATYAYAATASDVDAGDTLTFSLPTAPAGMTIDPGTGAITWPTSPADAGTHPVTVRVRDAANATAEQSFTLAVAGDTHPPIVTVLVQSERVNVGESATVTVLAIDDAAVTARQLTVAGSPVALDASFQATITATAPGPLPIVAQAIDPTGNLGQAVSALAVRDAADTTAPTVAIDAPVEDAEVTFLTDVTGSATDANLYKWTLARQFAGETTWTEFAAGYQPVTAGALGTLDPSLLENGIYLIRLHAEDVNGASAETIRGVRVDGQAKIGIFRISFVDLTIPLGGIPISVVRSYDSRVKETRDFGAGWDLDVSAGRVQHKVDLADGWVIATLDDPFSLPCQIVVDQKAHLTEVRLSERERYVFRPTLFNGFPFSGGCRADVGFELVDGTTPGAELEVIGNTSVRAPGAIIDDPGDPVGFNGTLTDTDTGLPYEARDFQLRTEDGRVFDLNIVRGVVRIADRNENEIFLNANGIVSSSGKSITFTRDTTGRITRIVDPMSRTLDYGYDAAGDLVSFTTQTADTTTFTYGTKHDLLEIHDPNGVRAAKQEYDADGRLVAVIDADGNRIELVHDLVARTEAREDRLGFRETFTYDARGNVTEQVDREGKLWTYAYDADDNQTSTTDPLGNRTTATFDSSHRRLTETNPLGDTRSWTYDAQGNVLTETDFDGKTTTNTYDVRGNLLTTTDPDGAVTTFTHDLQGNPTSITNALGHVARATYNIDGHLIATVDPSGHGVGYVYDTAGNTIRTSESRTRANGQAETLTTRFRYDAANRLIEHTDPLGHVTKTEYDRNGRVTAQVDPLGRRDERVYDELGRLVAQKAPDGATQRTRYDAEDQATGRIDEAGRLTQFFYDGTGRPTGTRYVDGTESISSYDDAGRLIRVVDRRGHDTEFGYDDAGRQTLVRDALDHETTTTYDDAGRRLTVTDANGRTTRFAYDDAGRLTTTTFPDLTTSTTEYDALGRVVAEIDPKGTRTEFAYDSLGRLMLVRDASGGETAYTYDEVGNRVAMTDALGRVRKYEYDSLGRMTAEVKPLGQRKTTTYDAVGQPISMRDYNGRASAMSYDPRGRLIHTRHGDGTETRYAYTVTGQLALVQDATGVTTFVYDDQDRLIEQVRPGGQTLRYGYDAEGNRTRLETPSGTTIFGYDAAGRPSTILDAQGGLTSYGYDAAGNRTSLTQPNGVTTTYARDDRDRLTTIESRTATNTLLARYAYTLDAAGNRTGVTEHGGRTVGWQYDALYRLVAETITEPAGSPETESFGYDAVGNRVLRATDAGVETSVYDDNDRLLDDGTATYTWDDQGNLRSKTVGAETTTYRWDGRDRLIEVSGPSTGLVQHVYDHAGDRVETRVDGVATKYLVDANRGLSEILEERTSAGSLIASYVHSDGGLPLARFDSVTWTSSYYLHDAQHSVRQLASVGGAVTDAYSYSAFGIARGATGSTPNAYRYDGEWNDARTQLYHFRARWLGPGAGGFLSSDPFAGLGMQPGSLHRYLFNLGNPISRSDPSGAFSMAEVGAAVQIAGTLASIAIPTFRAAQDLRAGVPLAEVTQQLAYEASINIASSVVAGGILRWAPRLLRLRPFGWMTPLGGRAARSVWSTVAGIAGNRARGEAIERIVLAGERRLPWNYPVIDDFLDNIAHSIKSIDLTAASNTATTIASTIRREARRLAEFVPQDWGAARLAGQTVAGRRLTVVFETGAADELQEQALRAVAREVRANLPEVLLEFRWIQ